MKSLTFNAETGETTEVELTAEEAAALAALSPPVPEPVPNEISDRQFFQALANMGLISENEALAAVKTGDLPQDFLTALESLPNPAKFNALMLLSGATVFQRNNPLVSQLGALLQYTNEQIDQIFIEGFKL